MKSFLEAKKRTIEFGNRIYIQCSASIVGKKEGEGPLGELFDKISMDDMFGGNIWEETESALQKETVQLCLQKANEKVENIRYMFAGDLLGQSIASSFGLAEYNTPFYDWIIVDCMPALGMITINALARADSILIPVQAAYLPVKGLQQLIKTIGKVKRQINPKLEIKDWKDKIVMIPLEQLHDFSKA